MQPEEFDDIIAEQAAQQQLLMLALRRIAALTRAQRLDPAAFAAHWKTMGARSIDKTEFRVAEGHEPVVRAKAKRRLANMIDVGLR